MAAANTTIDALDDALGDDIIDLGMSAMDAARDAAASVAAAATTVDAPPAYVGPGLVARLVQ